MKAITNELLTKFLYDKEIIPYNNSVIDYKIKDSDDEIGSIGEHYEIVIKNNVTNQQMRLFVNKISIQNYIDGIPEVIWETEEN